MPYPQRKLTALGARYEVRASQASSTAADYRHHGTTSVAAALDIATGRKATVEEGHAVEDFLVP